MLRRNSQHLLTVSEFSKQRIVHHLRVPASKISVIPLAADHLSRIASDCRVLARLDISPQRYCLTVGSLDPRKNQARCLAAIEQIACQPDFKFVLVGGGNARIFETSCREGAGAFNRVVQTGFVSDGELKALYENAMCFVFPSLYEGFGLPPLEAMYCNCPVIVSDQAALPEVCGDAAIYCDAESIDDIASKIQIMISDPELREIYRQRGLKRAHARSWRDAAEQFCEELAKIEASYSKNSLSRTSGN